MPMIRGRHWLLLACLVILYHWSYGLPTSLLVQPLFASMPQQTVNQATPPIIEVSQPWRKRIVAIGDLHGDLAHATRVLRSAGLIDHRAAWIGKTTTLVQTGDIVDRGKDTIALYQLFDTLRAQAALDGGEVISLLGNHEYMNAMGDWRYVTKEDVATFGGEIPRRRAFSSGWIGQTFLANYSTAARVAYGPPTASNPLASLAPSAAVVAVHGGIHPSWADVDRINSVGHKFLQRLVDARAMALPRETPPDEREFYSETGPVWYRGYALDSEEEDGICEQADAVLATLNATRMIMGHTPNFKGIMSRCRSKVIIIDTGISKAYGGVLSALEIMYTLTPSSAPSSVDAAREKAANAQHSTIATTKVTELEVVTAIYEGRRDVISRKERVIQV